MRLAPLAAAILLPSVVPALAPTPTPSYATSRPSTSPPDSVRARAILEQALAAHGLGDTLHPPRSVTSTFTGRLAMRGQSREANGPLDWEPARTVTTWDVAHDRFVQDAANTYPVGFLLVYRTVATRDSAFVIELSRWLQGAEVDRDTPSPLPAARAAMARELGPIWILHALAHGTAPRVLPDQRDSAPAPAPARTVHVLSLNDGAGEITAAFDARTHLLAWLETRSQHPIAGLERTRTSFGDYRRESGVLLPGTRRDTRNGALAQTGRIDWTVNAPAPDSLFAVPAGFHEASRTPADTATLRPLGGGAYALRVTTGYRAMVVEFDRFLVVVEAPINSALTERSLRAIAAAFPGKPVRYVAFTHHHTDHAGGLRPYIARGITVLTTPGERAFVERLARVDYPLHPDSQSVVHRRPVIETFGGTRRVSDGRQVLELHDMGRTTHASSMVFAYVPGARIVYDGDGSIFPADVDSVPADPLSAELARALRASGITDSATRILNTHVGLVPLQRVR